MLTVNYFVTDKSITLYWNKPYNLPEEYVFEIYVDGYKAGENVKTHFTLSGLNSDTVYQVQIALSGKYMEKAFVSEVLNVVTGRKKRKIDVTQAPYYAVGDGKTMNTIRLQQAINDCNAECVVYVPKGVYMTGALKMHSDMELYLEEGAVIQGTTVPEDYLPMIHSRFEAHEMECYSSLINMGDLDRYSSYNCKNVMIHGKGSIVGGGCVLAENIIAAERIRLADVIKNMDMKLLNYEKADTLPGRVRPRLVNMSNCQNIILSGITFAEGACWNVHMIYSDNIVTHNCVIESRGIWNGDGWDPDSSTNCIIFGTTFYTGDDSIAIKSGKNPEGNVVNRPCEGIRIFDCISKLGLGFAVGSEMSGGICDVQIWDCDLSNTRYGVEIKATKKRGGFVKNVQVRDSVVSRVMFHTVDYNDDGLGAEHPPVFADCVFENLHVLGEYLAEDESIQPCPAFEMIGFDIEGYEIQNILFKDIRLQGKVHKGRQKMHFQYCKNITLQNVSVRECK